jgi:hypothetical protein
MTIPESQLDIWSHQGSISQSKDTYRNIKSVLESQDSPYAKQDFTVFLQGSYGNDTNIYSESDVDIVIQLNSGFGYDINNLPSDQKAFFNQVFSGRASYDLSDFKNDVLSHLKKNFDDEVKPGDKAIKINAGASRRNADVLVCMGFRNYHQFSSYYLQRYTEGIFFLNSQGTRIVNYPKRHLENLTIKHQNTSGWYKPTIRILKNLRSRLVQQGMIGIRDAPSYYLEGMLYNVPNTEFKLSYENTVANCVNWLNKANQTNLVCANEQYYLLRDSSLVTWNVANFTAFLNAACNLWNHW